MDSYWSSGVRGCGMRSGITFGITPSDKARLEAIVVARGSPQKHVWRARIVLLSGDGAGTMAIMAATGKSKACVWRWQERFMAEGVDGLLRDNTRPPGVAPLAPEVVDKVVALTLEPPVHEATHWTVRAMAKAVGIAASSVVRIWHDHGLAPHRWRSFKLSNDKAFAEKLHDVVGLYVDPPAHAIVLSVDEKSQIQALDRTQPGLPLKKGRGGTMTHDYPSAKDEQIAAMGIALEALLDHQRQALHALPHIGVAHRDPYPRPRRDHRSAFNAAAAKDGGADAKMLTRLPRASSTIIAGGAIGGAAPSPTTTTASAKSVSATG